MEGGSVPRKATGNSRSVSSAPTRVVTASSLFCDTVVPKGTAASHESVEPRVAAIQNVSQVEELFACLGLEDVDLNHDEKEHYFGEFGKRVL